MSYKIGPILPDEVVDAKTSTIPSEIFEAFNELIAENWNGYNSRFTQEKVENRILLKMPDILYETIYSNRWLDVEDSYRQVGWTVIYDKPAYNETYKATFTFSKKK